MTYDDQILILCLSYSITTVTVSGEGIPSPIPTGGRSVVNNGQNLDNAVKERSLGQERSEKDLSSGQANRDAQQCAISLEIYRFFFTLNTYFRL